MTIEGCSRLQASIRQRLLNVAGRERLDFQWVLTRYALERLLHRLGRSPHCSSFVLKGALLFHAWNNATGRPTRDLDLLGRGRPDLDDLLAAVAAIAMTEVDDDGLDFLPGSISGEEIRGLSPHGGIRIRLIATLGRARIPVQIDVGFGDAAALPPATMVFPTLLDQEAPRILGYRPEHVVAEKLEALVSLGDVNTRIKDYYDIWQISRTMEMQRVDLIEAVRATFRQRRTALPDAVPPGLADDFAGPLQTRMWNAFVDRNGLDTAGATFAQVVADLRSYCWPLIAASRHQD